VYGAVVCSYDAVSLFYLELYVKLSVYVSRVSTLTQRCGVYPVSLHMQALCDRGTERLNRNTSARRGSDVTPACVSQPNHAACTCTCRSREFVHSEYALEVIAFPCLKSN
jgi:hypothetical protein